MTSILQFFKSRFKKGAMGHHHVPHGKKHVGRKTGLTKTHGERKAQMLWSRIRAWFRHQSRRISIMLNKHRRPHIR
ncbi:hypothetical protein KP509_27G053500 [Ceratopteris richardii]|uniref:Uncharacterized protein n=1 Tax=Ceratopteris richardii TaxID=49495 RepID=A0A8T2RI75_CERRI|nr:hypothetical protein KP509_27G053500 [Ceratopteris richardii]